MPKNIGGERAIDLLQLYTWLYTLRLDLFHGIYNHLPIDQYDLILHFRLLVDVLVIHGINYVYFLVILHVITNTLGEFLVNSPPQSEL